MKTNMEQSQQSKEAFEKHLKTHLASNLALIGADVDHRVMILSALEGTWMYAYQAGRKEREEELTKWLESHRRLECGSAVGVLKFEQHA